jgi:ankyrin repeat protein
MKMRLLCMLFVISSYMRSLNAMDSLNEAFEELSISEDGEEHKLKLNSTTQTFILHCLTPAGINKQLVKEYAKSPQDAYQLLRALESELKRIDKTIFDVVDNDGDTILHIACIRGNEELIKMLIDLDRYEIQKYFELQNYKDHNTPLHYASIAGNTSCIERILKQAGQNAHNLMHIQNKYGMTTLHCAAKRGGINTFDKLYKYASQMAIRKGLVAIKDNYGCTVLHHAVFGNNPAIVKKVLHAAGDNVISFMKMQNNKGQSAMTHVLNECSQLVLMRYVKYLILN